MSLSCLGNEQAKLEQEVAIEASQSLNLLWRCLQHGLVRQVADYFTDLMGPIKHLQEATCPPPGQPVSEQAYQDASDTFLVSVLINFATRS